MKMGYGKLPQPNTFQKIQVLFCFGKLSRRFSILKLTNNLGALETALIEQRVARLNNSKKPWIIFPTN